jgi:hypothetical protein
MLSSGAKLHKQSSRHLLQFGGGQFADFAFVSRIHDQSPLGADHSAIDAKTFARGLVQRCDGGHNISIWGWCARCTPLPLRFKSSEIPNYRPSGPRAISGA